MTEKRYGGLTLAQCVDERGPVAFDLATEVRHLQDELREAIDRLASAEKVLDAVPEYAQMTDHERAYITRDEWHRLVLSLSAYRSRYGGTVPQRPTGVQHGRRS